MVLDGVKAIPGLLSVRQTAKRLGFSKYGVMKAIQRGELPASHIDGFYVIAEGAVDDTSVSGVLKRTGDGRGSGSRK
jgi:hypothetical protein